MAIKEKVNKTCKLKLVNDLGKCLKRLFVAVQHLKYISLPKYYQLKITNMHMPLGHYRRQYSYST